MTGAALNHTAPDRYAVVVTSINAPTRAVAQIAREADRLGAHFIVIGDKKSPLDFFQAGADFLDIDAQSATGFLLAGITPLNHYARKNIGYLAAISAGATIIIETDDDNLPLPAFWQPRQLHLTGTLVHDAGWLNVYRYFTPSLIWPRGLPLDAVHGSLPGAAADITVACPIQQALADGDPDVDAIYRLLMPLPIVFEDRAPVLLAGGTWCPFNSQNTTWWRQAFPLLYLPSYCSFRMTDIWRSFVAQRIAAVNGWGIAFNKSTVFQERNEHNLMRDFEDEVPGYVANRAIMTRLEALDLSKGEADIPENMRTCYGALIEMGIVGSEEATLLDAWLSDLESLDRIAL